ncbi:MAG: glyoxalase superfamily protein [Hyphomicrobiales bacterium]
MNGSKSLPSLAALRQQAKRLRADLEAGGTAVSHSRALELLAHQMGFKDWNTLHASIGNRPPASPVSLGERVRGTYLGQSFTGDVIAVRTLGTGDKYRLTLHFDEPVDVVTFDSFSAFRQRINCTVDRSGATTEKTSDGRPHLVLEL